MHARTPRTVQPRRSPRTRKPPAGPPAGAQPPPEAPSASSEWSASPRDAALPGCTGPPDRRVRHGGDPPEAAGCLPRVLWTRSRRNRVSGRTARTWHRRSGSAFSRANRSAQLCESASNRPQSSIWSGDLQHADRGDLLRGQVHETGDQLPEACRGSARCTRLGPRGETEGHVRVLGDDLDDEWPVRSVRTSDVPDVRKA